MKCIFQHVLLRLLNLRELYREWEADSRSADQKIPDVIEPEL
jgi:hypothetical protein